MGDGLNEEKYDCPNCSLFANHYTNIQRCVCCGLGKTVGEITEAKYQNYHLLSNLDRVEKSKYFKLLYKHNIRMLKKGRALDVGCADGIFLDILSNEGWKAVGVESFSSCVNMREDIQQREFLDVELEDGFDLITFIHSFEHMERPDKVLAKCKKLLVPGGRLIVVVPNFESTWSRLFRQDWQWLNPIDHKYHYTSKALSLLLEKQCFKLRSVKTVSKFTPSILQMYLAANRVLDRPIFRSRLLRSAVFRGTVLLKKPANKILDLKGLGAELQITATL